MWLYVNSFGNIKSSRLPKLSMSFGKSRTVVLNSVELLLQIL